MRIQHLWVVSVAAIILISAGTLALAGDLSTVSVTLSDHQAGVEAIYTITFTTSATGNGSDVGLPDNGKIQFVFPAGFVVTGVDVAQSKNSNMNGGFSGITIVGQSVLLTRDGSGNNVPGSTEVSIAIGVVVNHQTVGSYDIQISTMANSGTLIDSGSTPNFSVTAGALDHFQVSAGANATAGSNFPITITAKDAYNNTVTSFASVATLTDKTGTMTPTVTGSFASGVWSGNLVFTKSYANNQVTVTYDSKSGLSALFNVQPAALDHFTFDTISSPKTAGSAFSIHITAKDQYDNTRTDFTDKVTLTDGSGSLNSTSDNFVAGVLNQNVTITKSLIDNYITANHSSSGKNGVSNLFNVNPASLSKFYINPISSPQTAGEWFSITALAQDVYNNTVTSFNTTVDISDLSASISPNQSGNFSNGQWTGSVKIGTPYTNNSITIKKTGGSEQGVSNSFNVNAGSLDHYAIAAIANQTAGVAFSITITAKDKENNTITSFAGPVALSDITGSISPTTSGIFTNGVWTGTVGITISRTSNQIFVSYSGKSSASNSFNVNPNSLDHFTFATISSPRIAGQSFAITIEARDQYENRVTTFSGTASLSDRSGTLTPIISTNFSGGSWSGNVTITKKYIDDQITATGGGKSGQSNAFNISPGAIHHLVVRDNPGGLGNEVSKLILNLNDQAKFYAAGYDQWNNYIRDVSADWGRTGTLDLPSPLQGTSTVLTAQTPSTTGQIYADSISVSSDSTGTISVATIHHVVIRDAANGQGNIVAEIALTADDSIRLHAAAYDAGNNYLGPAQVNWSNTGNLQPTISATNMSSILFAPTLAPASGKIIANHSTAIGDTTAMVTVTPGTPIGNIVLHPNPRSIAARLDSSAVVTSNIIYDGDGNVIASDELFTVSTSLGQIVAPADQAPTIFGHQVKSNWSGQISFTVQGDSVGGAALIHASSAGRGTATGDTMLLMTNVEIVAVTSALTSISQGQANIPLQMTVKNRGAGNVKIATGSAGLSFRDSFHLNRSGEYTVSRADTITVIPGQGGQRTLAFLVAASASATTDSILVDGYVQGVVNGKIVSDTAATRPHRWLVQTRPVLRIERVQASVDSIMQGASTTVTVTIRNDGDAPLVLSSDSLSFWASIQSPLNVTHEYHQTRFPTNPDTIPGHQSRILSYTVQVAASATVDTIVINAKASGYDANSLVVCSDSNADYVDGWRVKQTSYVAITRFSPSQVTVTSKQDRPWFLNLSLTNSGVKLKLDSVRVYFTIGGSDISSQYQVTYPDTFVVGRSDTLVAQTTDTLKITVSKTGTMLGTITIAGVVYLNDMISGQISKTAFTGIVVQSPAQLKIESIRTSQSEATVGQSAPWQTIVALTNSGGSDLAIDSTQASSFIQFVGDTTYVLAAPPGFQGSGNWQLLAGTSDSLVFVIAQTGTLAGTRQLRARILATEINSSHGLTAEKYASIDIEQPAHIRIVKCQNLAPNAPYVDTNQLFPLGVIIQNLGQDAARNIVVSLRSDSASTIENTPAVLDYLGGGQADTVQFNITAHRNWIISEVFRARIDTAVAENTPEPDKMLISAALDSVDTVVVQRPARMKILSVTPSQDTVRALSRDVWQVAVVVQDSGAGFIQLNQPMAADVAIAVDDTVQNDYAIVPPAAFQHSKNLTLSWWATDTLIYRVTNTGIVGGLGRIKVSLSGVYLNTNTTFLVKDSAAIYIRPSADVYIDVTEVNCPNVNQYGIGQVNTDQSFTIRSKIRNAGGERVDQVIVQLSASGYATLADTIDYLSPSGTAWAAFAVRAQHQPAERVDFSARIVAATSHESGLPAIIGAASDSIAAVRIHKPAVLRLSINSADTIFTSGQTKPIQVLVENLGTSEVDSSGELYIKMPWEYFVLVNNQPKSIDTTRFIVGQPLSYQVQPPSRLSTGDEIVVAISKPPLDRNTKLFAAIENTDPFDTLIVRTIPSRITIESVKITAPTGAIDDTLSTFQDFWLQVGVSYSENISNVRASLLLPDGYGFGVGIDSLQQVQNQKASWKLKAATIPHANKKWIKVRVTGDAAGSKLMVVDSVGVVTQSQAHVLIDRIMISWPPEAKDDSTLSMGQEFDLSINIINSGQARAIGPAYVRIHFGATGITTVGDTLKPFRFNSPVIFRLRAPQQPTAWAPLTVFLDSIPVDENTNQTAYAPILFKNFYVETQASALARIDSLWISSPTGAVDGILSTFQTFKVESDVNWRNCRDNTVSLSLQLASGFTTAESNPKNLTNPTGQGRVSWSIKAPEMPLSRQPIWLRLTAYDANSGEQFTVRSETLMVTIVNRAEVKLNAKIISPASAQDGIVSTGQEFVIAAFLSNDGDARLSGHFSAMLTLPEGQGYTTPQVATLTASHDDSVVWIIRAPLYERPAKSVQVQLVRSYPKDENSSVELIAEAILQGTVSFPIQTEEKSVTIVPFATREKNTIARGDTAISMLGLELICSGTANSNNVLFSGVKIKLKDRFDFNISPNSTISRIRVVKYHDNDIVYGDVTAIPATNPIEIAFHRSDTLRPEISNRIEFLVNVLATATATDFRLTIDSLDALTLTDEGSGVMPKLKNESGQNYDILNFHSEPSVLIEADFERAYRNFPNPFGIPERPQTFFIYYLDQDTEVKLQIYTLIGELVWSRSYGANQPQGRKGYHEGDIFWDGRNEHGHRVLNGVYIARISTGYGKSALTKIAVIK